MMSTNPFQIEDLLVFDDLALQRILACDSFNLDIKEVARSLNGASMSLVERIKRNVPPRLHPRFISELRRSPSSEEAEESRRRVLDGLFWELTYWKTPELYEALTEGEQFHPGIFQQLEPDLCGKTVLDAGAGCGRGAFECVRYGARQVYAVEPSPGLLQILKHKLAPDAGCVIPLQGSFDHIPLATWSVDTALSCSAFTAEPAQGGDQGLAELQRVTKRGGKIVVIWPRPIDYEWLVARGFRYVTLPLEHEMCVCFRSVEIALLCARRFYADNEALIDYIRTHQSREIPFSVLGILNPPHEYCWLPVK